MPPVPPALPMPQPAGGSAGTQAWGLQVADSLLWRKDARWRENSPAGMYWGKQKCFPALCYGQESQLLCF